MRNSDRGVPSCNPRCKIALNKVRVPKSEASQWFVSVGKEIQNTEKCKDRVRSQDRQSSLGDMKTQNIVYIVSISTIINDLVLALPPGRDLIETKTTPWVVVRKAA